jgi:hypothetical protein
MNLEDVILRDTRANQPAANTVAQGSLFYVTDEGIIERSTGAAWEAYSGAGLIDQLDILTHSDESASLPNSRRLLAGTNVTFDDSVANERTINAADTDTGITELTGDVTAGPGSGSQAATIANDAVTYGKIQNVSAEGKVLGRKTAGAGDIEEITVSDILDFITGADQGDIIYRDAAGWTRLAAGDAGKFLKTQGAGANPIWDTAGGGSGITELTGDVTAGPGSGTQAATIPNDTVEYAQMQNVSAPSLILGRKTAGAGDIEECTIDEILDFIGETSHGGILFKDATGWGRLEPGDDGQFLTTHGADADPTWTTSTPSPSLFVSVDVSEAELEALNSTPKVLVPAAGAGKIIIPEAVLFELTLNTVYANNRAFQIIWDSFTTNLLAGDLTMNTQFTPGVKIGTGSGPVQNASIAIYATNDPRNKALQLRHAAGNLTDNGSGTSSATLKVNLWYHIATVTGA